MSFGPVRPFGDWPAVQVAASDTRSSTFIPDGSVTDSDIVSVSPTKLRLIGAKVYRNAALSVSDITDTTVSWDTAVYNPQSMWLSTAPTKFTIPFDGIYSVTYYAEFVANATGFRKGQLAINGTATVTLSNNSVGGASPTQVLLSDTLKLSKDDYIEFIVRQNTGGALSVNTGEANNFGAIAYLGAI